MLCIEDTTSAPDFKLTLAWSISLLNESLFDSSIVWSIASTSGTPSCALLIIFPNSLLASPYPVLTAVSALNKGMPDLSDIIMSLAAKSISLSMSFAFFLPFWVGKFKKPLKNM